MLKTTTPAHLLVIGLLISPIMSTVGSATQGADSCAELINAQTAAYAANDWGQLQKFAQRYIEECKDAHGSEVLAIAHGSLAEAYLGTGKADAALRSADECIKAHYETVTCHLARTKALVRVTRMEDARSSYDITNRLIEHRKKVIIRDLGRPNPNRHPELNATELELMNALESSLERIRWKLLD